MFSPLDELKPGESAVIREIDGSDSTAEYLMELGLLVGTELRFIKFAPLGDPLQIKLRGYHLSLRREEAHNVLVEKIQDTLE